MSGSQVGTVVGGVVGAVVGFYAGNPIMGAQLGMAVGGTIGGAIDPTKVNGPHIGDGQSQSATDGQPIAWVMGTATVAGTIVQVSQRREVKIKDSGGKGGGPVVSHYDAVQDFAILICESSELRGSTIASVLMVEQDGKIVYDVRPESTILNDSFKWKANVDFLFGGEDQLPHPTLEAITGIGNTPSYRGSCLAVFKNFDVTLVGGRIPSFKFTVTSSATSTPVVVFGLNEPIKYKYVAGADGDNQELMGLDYSSPSYDDSEWPVGGGTVGNTYYGDGPVFTYVPLTRLRDAVWVRKAFDAPLLPELHFMLSADDWCKVWLNGTLIHADVPGTGRPWQAALRVDIPMRLIQPHNLVAVKLVDDHGGGQVAVALEGTSTTLNGVSLAAAVTAICVRGDLTPEEIDVTDLVGIPVLGYPVARDTTAADDLAPLLQAHFAYAAEYDGQLHFHLYGADALVTVAEDDLLEANDANDDNVVSTVRNQATEFPRKIVASYIDPAQNYMPVNVMAERLAVDVTAVGVQSMGIPVVMTADQAQQAVGKALKIAYATLEGTQEYSVPFARTATYLSLVAGDAVIFRGKRWVLDEVTLSNGFLKLAARRDRQSAYTSNVQAIVGNVPTPPASPYSGPTTLIPMNLPQLRPQDTSGLYLAAASTTGSPAWRGAQVQASYDGQVSWQNAVAINEGSTMGSVALPVPPGGQPLTVNTGGTGNLETVTAAQLAARANAFAFVSGDTAEIGQFQTATEDSEIADRYALTDVTRGLLGTTQVPATAGQVWTMLDSVYFLPIGVELAGTTIYLRAVGFGEVAEDAAVVSIVYNPIVPAEVGGVILVDGGGDGSGGGATSPPPVTVLAWDGTRVLGVTGITIGNQAGAEIRCVVSEDDGLTYQTQGYNMGSSIRQMVNKPGRYVALGASNWFAYADSPDGVWTYYPKTDYPVANVAGGINLASLIYDGDQFVCAGSFGIVITSAGGETWTEVEGNSLQTGGTGIGSFTALAFGSGVYYGLFMENGSTRAKLYSSTDLKTWTLRYTNTVAGTRMTSLSVANGKVFQLGSKPINSTNKPYILESSDAGSTWSDVSPIVPSDSLTQIPRDLVYFESKYVLGGVNSGGYSSDLSNWVMDTPLVPQSRYGIVQTSDALLATVTISTTYEYLVSRSTDGITWTVVYP